MQVIVTSMKAQFLSPAMVRHRQHESTGFKPQVLWFTIVPILCIASLALQDPIDPALSFDLAAAAATVSLVTLFWSGYALTRNALSPICLIALQLFALYPFHGWATFEDLSVIGRLGTEAETWRTYALLWVSSCVPFLWVGFQAQWPQRLLARLPSFNWDVDETSYSLIGRILIAMAIGWGARVVLAMLGMHLHQLRDAAGADTGNVFNYLLALLGNVPTVLCAYTLVVGAHHRRLPLIAVGVLFVFGEVGWGLLSGSRMVILAPLVSILIALSRGWRSFRLLPTVLILALFLGVVFPLVTTFRGIYSGRAVEVAREGVDATMVVDSFAAAVEEEAELAERDDPALVTLAKRLHGLTSFALIMRYTPERQSFMWGQSLILLPLTTFIPRFIWADKPALSPFPMIFNQVYWGEARNSMTSVAPSQLGYFWVNFYFPGILLGMYVLGIFYQVFLYRWRFGLRPGLLFPAAASAVLMMNFLHNLETSFDAFLAGLPKILLVYYLIAWVLKDRKQRRIAT